MDALTQLGSADNETEVAKLMSENTAIKNMETSWWTNRTDTFTLDLESFTHILFTIMSANQSTMESYGQGFDLADILLTLRPRHAYMCDCFVQSFQELGYVASVDELRGLPSGNETMENLTNIMQTQLQCNLAWLDRNIVDVEGKKGTEPLNPTVKGNCGTYFDGIKCWPESSPHRVVWLHCPDTLEGMPYDTSKNASRECLPGGIWSRANYNSCLPLATDDYDDDKIHLPSFHLNSMYYIYWTGYSTSLVVLLIALGIFFSYRSLWCMRNIIHINLISCFALHNITWILYSLFGHEFRPKQNQPAASMHICVLPTTLLKYLTAAGFFWMFVEGGYLFLSVMFSFHTQRIRFWMCAVVGWVIPFLLILVTSIVKGFRENPEDCWNEIYHLDYIFIAPVLLVLLANLVFLFIIMYVVFSKLQITIRAEARRYKKTMKALLILCPLLGVNYMLVLIPPTEPPWLKIFFSYFVSIMSSLQGMLVATFFCFFSTEVLECVKRTCNRSRDLYSLRRDVQHRHASVQMNRLLQSTRKDDIGLTLDTIDGESQKSAKGSTPSLRRNRQSSASLPMPDILLLSCQGGEEDL